MRGRYRADGGQLSALSGLALPSGLRSADLESPFRQRQTAPSVVSCRLWAVGCWLSAVSCELSVVSCGAGLQARVQVVAPSATPVLISSVSAWDGGYSSAVERRTVAPKVAGSNPVTHPNLRSRSHAKVARHSPQGDGGRPTQPSPSITPPSSCRISAHLISRLIRGTRTLPLQETACPDLPDGRSRFVCAAWRLRLEWRPRRRVLCEIELPDSCGRAQDRLEVCQILFDTHSDGA